MARDEGTHRFPLSVDKLASLFRGRGSSEIRERDEAAKQKGRVWGQKTIGATRAETKATRGDTQYGDASGSLTAHNARSRVNFCVPPCACPSSPSFLTPGIVPPSPLSPSLLPLSLSISLFLYPKVRAIHLTLPGATIRLIAPSLDRERATSSPGSNRIVRFPSNEQPRSAIIVSLSLRLFLFSILFFFSLLPVTFDTNEKFGTRIEIG